jgi:nucleobase:cation symporter-1, NCS1 family
LETTAERLGLGEPSSDRAFGLETHGIDSIPASERHGTPVEVFWVWLAANLIFNFVIIGAFVVSFGLNFWWASLAAIVGTALYFINGIGAMPGPVTGTATLTVSRSAFGLFGNIPAAALSWLTLVGWEAVQIVIGTLSMQQLLITAGAPDTTGLKIVCFVFITVATFAVAALGHATIVFVNRIMAWVLGIGTLGLVIFIVPKFNVSAAPPLAAPSVFAAFLLALVLTASGPLGWANYPSDYSRYLPAGSRSKAVAWWTIIGCAVPTIIITMIGIGAATATDMSDPIAGLSKLLPSWYLVPYLAVVVVGILTANFLNTYSSGMSFLSMGVRLKRYQAIFIDAVIASAAAIYALFIYDFSNSLIEFLSLLVIWSAPWAGIYTVNILMRRNRYDVPALYSKTGTYGYSNGWNWRAVGAFAAGIVAAALFANAPIYQGPLVGLIGGGDISIFTGLIVGGGLYYLLMRGHIQKTTTTVAAPAATAQRS